MVLYSSIFTNSSILSEGLQMNHYKSVKFEVIEIWYNDIYTPYTFTPISKTSEKNYAIKIGSDVFLLGNSQQAIYICDE